MKNSKKFKLLLGTSLAICSVLSFAHGDLPVPQLESAPTASIWAAKNALQADIRWTTYGVPHIQARSLEGLGFGFGYAQANDHLCLLAESYLRVNAQRARYFGAGGDTPETASNLQSDFVSLVLRHKALAEQRWPAMPVKSKAIISGYAKGYNRYLQALKNGQETVKHRCANQPWLREIAPQDVLAYLFELATFSGAQHFSTEILNASRSLEEAQAADKPGQTPNYGRFAAAKSAPVKLGSNAWAFGRDLTGAGGLLLANPHFPMKGNMRFWESHLRVPGMLNVAGASILGVPGVINIGFNRHLAWSHTYSYASHTIIYRHELSNQGKSYRFDGIERPIEEKTYTVMLKDGARIVPVTRVFYASHLGPLLQSDDLPNPKRYAYAAFDQNLANPDIVEHWLAMNQSENLQQFKQTFQQYDGTLFNNTLYADRAGNTYYIDDSSVPDLPVAALAAIAAEPKLGELAETMDSVVVPANGQATISSGPVKFAQAPQLQRSDYVQNANDSYWLTNLNAPLTGYSTLYGPTETAQSMRTRLSLSMLQEFVQARRNGQMLRAKAVEAAMFSNRAYLPQLLAADMQALCKKEGHKVFRLTASRRMALAAPCAVMARADNMHASDSVGSPLWREFASLFEAETMLEKSFDPRDPVNTPAQLRQTTSVAKTLARAAANLQDAGWRLDASLAQMQYLPMGAPAKRISWPGGNDPTGGFNIFSSSLSAHPALDVISGKPLISGLDRQGYAVDFGSSWIMLVDFTSREPIARGLMTYSQSSEQQSAHAFDQSQRYASQQGLRPMPFTEEDIRKTSVRSLRLR